MRDVIFTYVCRLIFYTIYHDKAHNNHHTMAYNGLIRWHNRPYDIPIRQAWTVRAAAAIIPTLQKYRINLTPSPPPFIAFSFYFFLQHGVTVRWKGNRTLITDRIDTSNTLARFDSISSSSSSNNNKRVRATPLVQPGLPYDNNW